MTLCLVLALLQDKPPAPKGNYFQAMPRGYGRFLAYDPAARLLRFVWDEDGRERKLPLLADAEVQRMGYWAEPEEFGTGDRVWLAIEIDDKHQWLAVRLLLDGVSAQAMFADTYTVGPRDAAAGEVELVREHPKPRRIRLRAGADLPPEGTRVYWNARGEGDALAASDVLGPEAFEKARAAQVRRHFERLASAGLSGLVNDVDPIDGRLIVTVRRADTLWARTLKMNATVIVEPIGEVKVHEVRPDYARAKVKLVAEGVKLTSLVPGMRVRLKMEAPKDLNPDAPPDPGRFTERPDRIAWFLSSVYCICGMPHDG